MTKEDEEKKEEAVKEEILLKVKPSLFTHLNTTAKNNDIDISTLIQKCIRTGLFLGDVNSNIHLKIKEETESDKRILEALEHRRAKSNLIFEGFTGTRGRIKGPEDDETTLPEKEHKIVKVRVDMDFYEQITNAAKRLNVDTSTYIRYCIRTGIYLEDLNKYIQMRTEDEE